MAVVICGYGIVADDALWVLGWGPPGTGSWWFKEGCEVGDPEADSGRSGT